MVTDQATEVLFNRPVAFRTRLMGLKCPEIAGTVRPGQFVMLRVRSGTDPLLRRPFSVSGVEGSVVRILYRVVGRGTQIMEGTGIGEKLRILGPLGRGFRPPGAEERPLLLAGGIGVAPLLFLARTLATGDAPFLAGFGSGREVIDLHELGNPASRVSLATDDGTRGHAGPVTDLLEDLLARDALGGRGLVLYACGPMPMLERAARIALERGISCQVSMESFMACGLGACQGCALEAAPGEGRAYHHACKDGPVFDAESLAWEGT
ncbi:MAG: dihydroorotate dehydrogenase electron transfer subunit [Deltaproteobacteria bacterium]|nr:dihydroorotate dehydrogenase electron transfer subunit [Deltaproteobacteria bacterium]